MRYTPLLATLAALTLTSFGCSPPAPAAHPAASAVPGFPMLVTDDDGRRVTIPSPPQRIVSVSPAHTESLYELGAGDKLVAADTYSDFPPEVRPKATLNCWPRIPLEQMVALKPDLVLVLTQNGEELRRLDAAGIRVIQLFPKTYAETLNRLELLGRITRTEARAAEIIAAMRRRVDAIEQRVKGRPRVRVVYELDATDAARPWVAGGGAIYNEVIRLAGGENLFAAQKQPTLQVSAEQIIAANPDVILLGDMESPLQPQRPEMVRERVGWSNIAAVRNGRIFGVKSERITRPAPRFVEGLEEVAERLTRAGTQP